MGWQQPREGSPRYYYKKERMPGGRVKSRYVGRGPQAELVAALDQAARGGRAYVEAALAQHGSYAGEALGGLAESGAALKRRIAAVMERRGYRYHRGEWRRPRAGGPRAGTC
jgi:hypothetical protein